MDGGGIGILHHGACFCFWHDSLTTYLNFTTLFYILIPRFCFLSLLSEPLCLLFPMSGQHLHHPSLWMVIVIRYCLWYIPNCTASKMHGIPILHLSLCDLCVWCSWRMTLPTLFAHGKTLRGNISIDSISKQCGCSMELVEFRPYAMPCH
jgi:hypothetical protein